MPQFKLLEKAGNRLKQIAYKQVKLKNVCILPVCMWTYCARRLTNALGHTVSNDFVDNIFTVERRQASALLNTHVSLYFSVHGKKNMLQVISYTGQNTRTTKKQIKPISFKL